MTPDIQCQLKETDGKACGNYGFTGADKYFNIDNLVLCANHTEFYIHQQLSSLSVHRKTFDKLLNRMEFIQ